MATLRHSKVVPGPLVVPYAEMLIDGPEIGTLVVVVDRAKNLPNRRTMGKQDPYCAMRLGKEAKKTASDRRGGQTPRWDQELRFTVRDSPDHYRLKCSVFNDDKKTELIGEAWIDLKALIVPGGGQNDLWHQLSFKGRYAGDIRMEMTYYDTRENVVAEVVKERRRTKGPASDTASITSSSARQSGPREVKRRPLPPNPDQSVEGPNPYHPQPRKWSSQQSHDVFAIDADHHAAEYNPYELQENAPPFQEYFDPNSVQGQFPGDDYNSSLRAYPSDPRPSLPHSNIDAPPGWHPHSSPTVPPHQMSSSPYGSPHQSPPALPDMGPRPHQLSTSSNYAPYQDSPLRQAILPHHSPHHELSGHQDRGPPPPPTHRNSMPPRSSSAQSAQHPPQERRRTPQPLSAVRDPSPRQMLEHSPSPRQILEHNPSPVQRLEHNYQTQRALPAPPDRRPRVADAPDEELIAGEFPAPHQLSQNFGVDFATEPVEQDNHGRYIRRNSGLEDGPYRLQRSPALSAVEVFDEHNTYRSQPQVVKPCAVSPNAGHLVPRKSISPRPQVQVERLGMGTGTVPFGPDSYDVLVPDSGGPTRNMPVQDGREMARQNEVDKLRDQGPIIGNDGRVIDPSDHLPSDTWAPEPERKHRQPEHVIRIRTRDEARHSQSGSSPVRIMPTPPYQPRYPTHQLPNQSAQLTQATPYQSPQDNTSHRRNRLQKAMPSRASPIQQAHSSPTGLPPGHHLTHELRNSAPTTPLSPLSGPGSRPFMYSTPASASSPSLARPALSEYQLAPANYHDGRGPPQAPHQPNAPTEMGLQRYVPPQGGYADPLAAEMSMIDIGPSRGGKTLGSFTLTDDKSRRAGARNPTAMDSGHSHPSSVQAAFHKSTPPILSPEDGTTPPSRQQRLLRARNARFAAKRISISGISARFSDMIKPSEDRGRLQPLGSRNQENESCTRRRPVEPATQSASSPLGILGELSSSASGRLRPRQKRLPIPIFQDTAEGSLPNRSRCASPTVYQDPPSPVYGLSTPGSPHGSFAAMGLKEISGNARRSPATDSPGLAAARHHPTSYHISRLNPEQYIEHLEKHLELVKNDAYSPESNRPWKEKLKAADAEKDRLKAEARQMKAAFEAELQKTVEHMTATEVELQRKIRALEEDVEQKNVMIQELEMQHEERRLDQSTVDALKSTIDKLEQEKRSLEQCNESISRRNEALTQLLAISPTKTRDPVNVSRSPGRVRRKGRPQSLIIARMPSSPDAALWGSSRPFASSTSPGPRRAAQSATAPFPHCDATGVGSSTWPDFATAGSVCMGPPSRVNSCRSPPLSRPSRSPPSGSPPLDAFINQTQPRPHSKHRARRFVQGSTQLKPLLLPFLMGENGAVRTASPSTPPRPQPRNLSEHSIPRNLSEHSIPRNLSEHSIDATALLLAQPSHPTQAFAPHASSVLDDATKTCFESAEEKDGLEYSSAWSYSSVSEQLELALRHKLDSLMSPVGSCINLPSPRPRSQSPEEDEKTLSGRLSLTPDSLVDLSGSVEVPLPLFSPSAWQGTSRRLHRRHWNAGRTPDRSSHDDMKSEVGIEPDTPCQKRRNARSSPGLYKTPQENYSEPGTPIASKSPMQREEYQRIAGLSSSPPRSSSPLVRPQTPLEVLYKGGMARSLTDSTLTTICGAWSRYVKSFAVLRRSTLDLARRVIANAWHAKWTFCGMLSWWVLGLFMGSSWRQSRPLRWNKHETTGPDAHGVETSPADCEGTRQEALRNGSPGWTQRLLLWGKFSIAIMMAVGGAVVQGPAEMLREAEERTAREREEGGMSSSPEDKRPRTLASNGHLRQRQGHGFHSDHVGNQPGLARLQQCEFHSDHVGNQPGLARLQQCEFPREDSDSPCSSES
ncbi:hypothetical protein DV735_g4109, partial [Chaetothyriales sp. CBS 134920]